MDFQAGVNTLADQGLSLVRRKRHAIVGDLDRFEPHAFSFLVESWCCLKTLGGHDIFEELSANKGFDVIAFAEPQFLPKICSPVEARRTHRYLYQVHMRADQSQ